MQVAFEGGLLEIGDPDRNPDLPWARRGQGDGARYPNALRVGCRLDPDRTNATARSVRSSRADTGVSGMKAPSAKPSVRMTGPAAPGLAVRFDHQVSV